jgi:hypothetical protein
LEIGHLSSGLKPRNKLPVHLPQQQLSNMKAEKMAGNFTEPEH